MRRYSGILSLDLSPKSTGWAHFQDGKLSSSVWTFPFKSNPGQLYHAFDGWISTQLCLRRQEPHLIILEQPHFRGRSSFYTVTMFGITVMNCARFGPHACHDVHSSTLKKFATGSGRADKEAMVAAGKARGWQIRNDDEADALWLCEYAKHMSSVGHWPQVEGVGSPLTKTTLTAG